jgi:hypothetical protein
VKFFVGIHLPNKAQHFDACCVSVKRLEKRLTGFAPRDWIMDSGAFSTISTRGGYGPDDLWLYQLYIENFYRWGNLEAAVSQDYMCEPEMLERTGMSVREHQRLTTERYSALKAGLARSAITCAGRRASSVYIMPVLQGYAIQDYVRHLADYGRMLSPGMWVGVGSVCKRNRRPDEVEAVLAAIKAARPDLRLHGFGVKATALASRGVRALLHSADSMAWSFAARRQGRDQNDWREAAAWAERIRAVAP